MAGRHTKYYDLLGVAPNASGDDIKKGFKKQALIWHPDRNPDKREEAEARFKEIQTAYSVLSDPNKKEIYDQAGEEGLREDGMRGGGGGFPFGFGGFPFGFGGDPRGGGAHEKRRTPDIQIELPVSLSDFFRGKKRKLQIPREVTCDQCLGVGSEKGGATSVCPTCRGSKRQMVTQRVGPGMIQQMMVPCRTCEGRGDVIAEKDRCTKCKGRKTSPQEKTFEVHILPGMQPGQKVKFFGEANEQPGAETGDVVVVLVPRESEEGAEDAEDDEDDEDDDGDDEDGEGKDDAGKDAKPKAAAGGAGAGAGAGAAGAAAGKKKKNKHKNRKSKAAAAAAGASATPASPSKVAEGKDGKTAKPKSSVERPKFHRLRNGVDLLVEKKISLAEALLGFEFAVRHLDDRVFVVRSQPGQICAHDDILIVEGEGMPIFKQPGARGDLYLKLSVVMPSADDLKDSKTRDALTEALPRRPALPDDLKKDSMPETVVAKVVGVEQTRERQRENARQQRESQEAHATHEDDDGHGHGGGTQCRQM